MTAPEEKSDQPATWRVLLAAGLDFLTALFVLGYLVAIVTGSRSADGISLTGGPAFLLFALVLAYFLIFNQFLGGTIWKRILRAHRTPPAFGPAGPPTWRIVTAAVLDFFTAFFAFGYVVAVFAGATTEKGFSLDGPPAMVLLALIAAYFFVFNRFLGGTIWKRVLRAQR
jgi:hypothetical protein